MRRNKMNEKVILSIDPGTTHSAYTVVDVDTYKIIDRGILPNEYMIKFVKEGYYDYLVVEGMSSYNQPIGQETMDTIFLSGRLFQIAEDRAYLIKRHEVKTHFGLPKKCNADSYIRIVLIDRFAQHDRKTGRGTKKNPDWFYKVSADTWQAYALAVCWIDRKREST